MGREGSRRGMRLKQSLQRQKGEAGVDALAGGASGDGGAGGGGYSGGGADYNNYGCGGGSYNAGANTYAATGSSGNDDAHGRVQIVRIG